jgi:hypothetical protein
MSFSFFNTVWLILNDITIGVAFGSFLCENNVVLARMLNHLIKVGTLSFFPRSSMTVSGVPRRMGALGSALARLLARRPQIKHGAEPFLFAYIQ